MTDIEKELQQQLTHSNGVLIITHKFPDPDAIGSSLSWYLQLKKRDVPVTLYVADNLYDQFHFLPSHDVIQKKSPYIPDIDTILVLDCSDISRVKNISKIDYTADHLRIINIDHHADNTSFGHINLVKHISSVGEYSFELFNTLGWDISPEIATCLYSAIVFDTGSFTNTNVTADTFNVCSQLMALGAEKDAVTEAMFESYTEASYDMLKVALDNLVVKKDYAYTTIPRTANVESSPIKLVDFVRKLKGIQVAIVMRQMDSGLIKINLRSKSSFNVSKFAQLFGGGGHHRASGINMTCPLDDAIATITEKLESVIDNPDFLKHD